MSTTNGTVPAPARARLSLKELEESLPTPEEVAAQAQQLRAASVGCINIVDVNEMMHAVLKKAKEGDPKCTKLILDHLNSHKPEPPRPAPIQLKPAAPEPPRVVERVVEKTVAVDSPGTEQHRRLAAYILLAHQPMSLHGLGQQCGLDADQVNAVLSHEWFGVQNGQARLTPAGRQAVG
jgi:hypothetical protein